LSSFNPSTNSKPPLFNIWSEAPSYPICLKSRET
jgi:hypothetical protein